MCKSWKKIILISFSLVLLGGNSFSAEWIEIGPADPGNPVDILHYDPDFSYEGLNPGCAARPLPGGGTTDPEFRFFVKEGNNNLFINFHGGGFCYDSFTCIFPDETFVSEIDITTEWLNAVTNGDYSYLGGAFLNDVSNPFNGWSHVFIPYCTGDIHIGAKDHDYATILDLEPKIIRHRGAVNFQMVLKWMKDYIDPPDNIFIIGLSAAAYGALIQFPHIQAAFPSSNICVVEDSGAILVTSATWNAQLPDDLVPELAGRNFANLSGIAINKAIADQYPDTRFAAYTTNSDTIQVEAWLLSATPLARSSADVATILWYNEALTTLKASSNNSENFKYYIAAGEDHTIMGYPKFYTEYSAGKSFLEWIEEMLNPAFNWNNSQNYESNSCFISTARFFQ